MKKKMKLNDLSVTSFVTEITDKDEDTLKGGGSLFGTCGGRGCSNAESCIPVLCMAGATEQGAPGCPDTQSNIGC